MTPAETIDYLRTQPLELALWWFIENVNEETPGRTEVFFFLRERVRNEAKGTQPANDWKPIYSRWRHGGWYVHNVRYPSGACGCVSRNYPDGKWRIACDSRRTELGAPDDYTFPSRDAAARAEFELAKGTQP